MFNVFLYDQKLQDRKRKEKEAIKAVNIRQGLVKARKKLTENYEHRIKTFMIAMIKEPQKIKQYKSPLEIAGRTTDPSKYKGSANIILKGYKTERERIYENQQKEIYTKSNPVTPTDVKITKHIENQGQFRMYFKPRTNLERIKDELQQRHVNIAEIEGEKIKEIPVPHNLSKSQSKSDILGTHIEDSIQPKQIFASLHNKTYFKAVKTVQNRSSPCLKSPKDLDPKILRSVKNSVKGVDLKPDELALLAGEALRSCNVEVIPNEKYLKIGHGKLVSNPDQTVLETYEVLNRIP